MSEKCLILEIPKNQFGMVFPREEIRWHPTVEDELCIGCGLCVLGCGADVYEFNFEKKKPVVVAPTKCKVGCVTCANTCPSRAISFPPLTCIKQFKRGMF